MVSRIPQPAAWRAVAEAGAELRASAEAHAGPGVPSVTLPGQLYAELIAWARSGVPNEACGLLAGDRPALNGGRAIRFLPLRNAAESPYRYLIEPDEQLAAMLDIDDADEVVWGIFHSHVASPAEPSVTDIGLAFYPDSLYLICSLAADPHVRAWTLDAGTVTEVEFTID